MAGDPGDPRPQPALPAVVERWSGPPVLFLDVDGVLNTAQMPGRHALHPKLLGRLRAIVDATGCSIVLSTTWRLREENAEVLLTALELAGIPRSAVIGGTPVKSLEDLWPASIATIGECRRAAEIAAFLDAHPTLERSKAFAVVDDLDVLATDDAAVRDRLSAHFVRTDVESGLTDPCRERLEVILAPHPEWA